MSLTPKLIYKFGSMLIGCIQFSSVLIEKFDYAYSLQFQL